MTDPIAKKRVCGMKTTYPVPILIGIILFCGVSFNGHAQQSAEGPDIAKWVYSPASDPIKSSNHARPQITDARNRSGELEAPIGNGNDPAASGPDNQSATASAGQSSLFIVLAEFKDFLLSHPSAKDGGNSYWQEVFLLLHADKFLSPGLIRMKDKRGIGQLTILREVLNRIAFGEKDWLKPAVSTGPLISQEEKIPATRYDDQGFKPFIRNPFPDGTLSLSLPIAATSSLTIAPAITYAFSINDTHHPEYRGKKLISLMNDNSAIVYGGIHLCYAF